MPDSYIVWFSSAADMIRHLRRTQPRILAIGFDDGGRCHYVGLCRANGANYR